MFRNATFFRFPASLVIDQHAIDAGTRECALKPVGPLEMKSRGFVSLDGTEIDDDHQFPYVLSPHTFLMIGTESKILPGSVVQAAVAKRLAEIEAKEGRKLGGRARKALREELVNAMLPAALVKPGRILAALTRDLLIVDTASRSEAESVVSDVRHALGSFPALPLNAEAPPRAVLTGWIAGDPLPEGLALGDVAWLSGADKATVKVSGVELTSEEVLKHVEAGMQVTRLELVYGDRVRFVLDDGLVLRSIKLLDGALEDLTTGEDVDVPNAELEARLLLGAGEVLALFDLLEPALKISKVD